MLSQEELDKLLAEGLGEENSPAQKKEAENAAESPAQAQPQAQDNDLDWGAAFQEAAQAGDAAAAKALVDEDRGLGDVASVPPQPSPVPPSKPEPPRPTAQRQAASAAYSTASKATQPSFDDFSKHKPATQPSNGKTDLDFILDIPLEVSVEVGRKRMLIRDLLQLGQGAIVALEKLAGEPAEIYVNQRLMGKGEIVMVNDKFGIRLTEIISPADRIRNLA